MLYDGDTGENTGENTGGSVGLKSVRPGNFVYLSFAWKDGENILYVPEFSRTSGELLRVRSSGDLSPSSGATVNIFYAYTSGDNNAPSYSYDTYRKDLENTVITITPEAFSSPEGSFTGGNSCSNYKDMGSIEYLPKHGSAVVTLENNNGACAWGPVLYADGYNFPASGGSVSVDLTPVIDSLSDCYVVLSALLFVALVRWVSSVFSSWRRSVK